METNYPSLRQKRAKGWATRPTSVWTAIVLQLALVSYSAYWWAQLLLALSQYADRRVQQVLIRAATTTAIPSAASAVSLIGLWRVRRWGWVLAVLVDAYSVLSGLRSLHAVRGTDAAVLLLRTPSFVTANLLHIATLFVLLSHPVREYFFGVKATRRSGPTRPQGGGPAGSKSVTYDGRPDRGSGIVVKRSAKISNMIDRTIVCLIAAVQLLVSGFAAFQGIAVDYLGFHGYGMNEWATAFFVVGVLSALALFTGRFVPRFTAAVWLVPVVYFNLPTAGARQGALTILSFLMLLSATIYLGITAILQFQKIDKEAGATPE